MTWSRFDDLYDEHEKVEEAWDTERATIGLHVMATTACNRWLSDGVIRPRWLHRKLPTAKERARVLPVMVSSGLFDCLPAGVKQDLRDSDDNVITVGPYAEDRYVVHDFLDRHDSSVQVKDRRQRDAARKKAGRAKDSDESPNGVHAESTRSPAGRGADSARSPGASRAGARAGAPPRPDPTLPDPRTPPAPQRGEWASPPVRPKGQRARALEAYKEEVSAYAAWLLPDTAEPERTQAVEHALSWLPGRTAGGGEVTHDHVRRFVAQDALGARVVELNDRATEAA